jgi:HSP20 family molecular chaperone IbpA
MNPYGAAGIFRALPILMQGMCSDLAGQRGAAPHVLRETADEIEVQVPLPGFDSREVEVFLEGNELVVIAEHAGTDPESVPGEDAGLPHGLPSMPPAEYPWQHPRQTARIWLPRSVSPEGVTATIKKGLLDIRLRKQPRAPIPLQD